MIAANNHYAGFGPGTANLFRKMVGLSELPRKIQQIQKHLQLLQQQQKEKQDQHVNKPRIVSKKKIKNRQSSLSEFID
jgi:predicted transcriptional regulator